MSDLSNGQPGRRVRVRAMRRPAPSAAAVPDQTFRGVPGGRGAHRGLA